MFYFWFLLGRDGIKLLFISKFRERIKKGRKVGVEREESDFEINSRDNLGIYILYIVVFKVIVEY